jgi:hypothetical protein
MTQTIANTLFTGSTPANPVASLRLPPAADQAAIVALTNPQDFSIVKKLDDGKSFIFQAGAVTGGFADVTTTGFWVEDAAATTTASGTTKEYIFSASQDLDVVTANPVDWPADHVTSFVTDEAIQFTSAQQILTTIGGVSATVVGTPITVPDGTIGTLGKNTAGGLVVSFNNPGTSTSISLRIPPVSDSAALVALVNPADFTIVKTADNAKIYTFTVGAVAGDFADVNATGFWIEESAGTGGGTPPGPSGHAETDALPANLKREVNGKLYADKSSALGQLALLSSEAMVQTGPNTWLVTWYVANNPTFQWLGTPHAFLAFTKTLVTDVGVIRATSADGTSRYPDSGRGVRGQIRNVSKVVRFYDRVSSADAVFWAEVYTEV